MFTLPFDRRSQLPPSKLQRAIPKQRQQLAPPSPLSSDVLMLQRTIGNRAVSQLLGRQRSCRQEEQQRPPTIQRTPVNSSAPKSQSPTIQRWSLKNLFKKETDNSQENSTDSLESKLQSRQVKKQGKNAPDRYELTMGVKRENENYLTQSAKFVGGKYARKMGFKLGPQNAPKGTGHAWVVLNTYKEGQLLESDSFGLGQRGIMHPDPYADKTDPGTFYKDHTISADAYKRVFARILALRQQFINHEIAYDLFGLNCTAFVRDITRTAGLSFPGSKVLPFVFHGMASSFTPNKLYKALEKQQKKGVARVYANQKDKNKSKSQNKPSLGKRLLNMLTFQSSAPQVTSSNSQSQPVESQQSEQITQSQESVNQQAPVEPVEEVQDEFFPSPYENVQRYKLPENTALTALDQNQVPVGTVQGGTTIGVTGVVRNGVCEIIWRGKPHYISERAWKMFVRVAYSDIARSGQNVSVGED